MASAEPVISITSPLGKDALSLKSFTAEEGLSRLFVFHAVAQGKEVDPEALIGKSITLGLAVPGGAKRHFNGVCTRLVLEDAAHVLLELRPWLWELDLEFGCKIFQNKSAKEIIAAVFDDLGYADYKDSLVGTYEKREYCVQYQETAFNFVSRLMEEEGMFYFFEHVEGKHTLVLADDGSAHAPCPGKSKALYRQTAQPGYEADDTVSHCASAHRLCSGKYAADDYNFETPSTELLVSSAGKNPRKVYEYPGVYFKKGVGDGLSKRRLEALELPLKTLEGDSRCRFFIPGYKMTLAEHPTAALNADYVLESVSHRVEDAVYANRFTAFPAATPYRPQLRSAKPRIAGSQTALVVGKSGEEIYTDKYGRLKVQFHWDQDGTKDENSSCWVRVAQTWAGKGWGGWWLPRVGMEVVVSFLDGDPDRPLVSGAVYNGDNALPYTLPADQTKSTIKSDSSKGHGGSNEIRFEDKKDSEEIYVHAQKDQTIVVENTRTATMNKGDEIVTVKKGKREITVEEGDDLHTVKKGNRTYKVETGDETYTVEGTRTLSVTKDETHTDKANFTHEVTKDYTLTVKGNLVIDVTGDITFKAGKSLTAKAGTELTNQAGTALTNKAGTDLTNQSGTSLTNKAGTSLTNQGGVDLTDKAPMITVKADASGTVDGGGMLTVKGGLVKIN